MKPVVLDLCCGLGGWTQGFLSEGWDCIGFDIERHEYGDKRYPGELILKSILDLNGYDLRAVNPALVVASPPCQAYSYMAMPFSRGKREAAWQRWERDSPFGDFQLNALFNTCFRIAREIGCPIVLENVQGAQSWVGRANAHYGSFYLWGDVGNVGGRVVRADRPPKFGEYVRARSSAKASGQDWNRYKTAGEVSPHWRLEGAKTVGHVNKRDGFDHTRHLTNQRTNQRESDGVKQHLSGPEWFDQGAASVSSKSDSRKAASAMIAEIPFPLAQHIARVFKPR